MKQYIQQVNFRNKRKESQFDFLLLEDLVTRKDIKDSLINYQKNNFYSILFCTDGQGLHSIDFVDYTFQKGTILTIRKDQIHKFYKTSAKGFLLIFTEEFLIFFFEKSVVLKCLQLFNELITIPKTELDKDQIEENVKLISKIQHEYFHLNDEFSLAVVSSLLHIFLNQLLRLKKRISTIKQERRYLAEFIKLQSFIENHCLETKKVEDYALKMNVSTKTINNITQSVIHKSAKLFIDEIVILQIKRLLMDPQYTIKEIAYQSGFDETANFYKFFKKYVQRTPEQFRNTYL
jgi:AraC family transcriptional regulator, transcriptional activator of pobA